MRTRHGCWYPVPASNPGFGRQSSFEEQWCAPFDELVDTGQFVIACDPGGDRPDGSPRLLETIPGPLRASTEQHETGGTAETIQIVPVGSPVDE